LLTVFSADLSQIAERLKNPAKAISLMTTALAGGFFLKYSQIKTGYLNHIVRPTLCRSTKKGKMNKIVKSFVHFLQKETEKNE
tara:strand:+ start:266 stop:514 length:249 start_codon:yes stop_codon:yes gene_type:complete